MTVPLTLLAARLHWRWVLLALLLAAVYYYIMYRLKQDKPLAELTLTVYGKAGKGILWLTALWLVWLAGYLAVQSASAFPQTAQKPLTGLLLLLPAAGAAKNGSRSFVRCAVLLLLLLGVLYGIVLIFSAPQVQARWLAPTADVTQALLCFPFLTLPTLLQYHRPVRDGTKMVPWLAAGGVLALAASVITAGCLSPALAAESMSFYELSQSVSLFGTALRFEALISAACLIGYFCAIGFVLCTARQIIFTLLPGLPAQKIILLPFAAAAALLSIRISAVAFSVGAAIFCAVFPLVTQGIGGRKKV